METSFYQPGKKHVAPTAVISSYFISCKNYQAGMIFFFLFKRIICTAWRPLFGDSHFLASATGTEQMFARRFASPCSLTGANRSTLFAQRVRMPVVPFPRRTLSPCCPSLVQEWRTKKTCARVIGQFATHLAGPRPRAHPFGLKPCSLLSFRRLLFAASSPDSSR